jgi:hypothetical protein
LEASQTTVTFLKTNIKNSKNLQKLDSKDIVHFCPQFILCNNINHANIYKIHCEDGMIANKKVEVIPTPTKTKQAIYIAQKGIIAYYYKEYIYLIKGSNTLERWAACKRCDKYKVLRKDEGSNLFYTTSKNSICIVKNLEFKSWSSQTRYHIQNIIGNQIQDFRPFTQYSMILIASKDGIISLYSWKG